MRPAARRATKNESNGGRMGQPWMNAAYSAADFQSKQKNRNLSCKNKHGTTVKKDKIAVSSVQLRMCIQIKIEKMRFRLYL